VTSNEPTPVPLEERPEEDLTPAELRELLRRVRQVYMHIYCLMLMLTSTKRGPESKSIKHEAEPTTRVKRERAINDEDEVTYVETRQRKRPHVKQEVIVID
jgi:hypothetical protein